MVSFVLGDKAYVGDSDVLAPYKKKPGQELSSQRQAFNIVHRWFRATVEHTIAQCKKYAILVTIARFKVRFVVLNCCWFVVLIR